MPMDLREQKFGIEIELTGLTRKRAAEVIGKYLGQEPNTWVTATNMMVVIMRNTVSGTDREESGKSCMTPVLLQ